MFWRDLFANCRVCFAFSTMIYCFVYNSTLRHVERQDLTKLMVALPPGPYTLTVGQIKVLLNCKTGLELLSWWLMYLIGLSLKKVWPALSYPTTLGVTIKKTSNKSMQKISMECGTACNNVTPFWRNSARIMPKAVRPDDADVLKIYNWDYRKDPT